MKDRFGKQIREGDDVIIKIYTGGRESVARISEVTKDSITASSSMFSRTKFYAPYRIELLPKDQRKREQRLLLMELEQ